MKVPLNYQVTSFDCATTSIINAISYLYNLEEFPVQLLKMIYANTLDEKDDDGVVGGRGTSLAAIKKLVTCFNNFHTSTFPGITCEILKGEQVSLDKLRKCILNNGCILARCYQLLNIIY